MVSMGNWNVRKGAVLVIAGVFFMLLGVRLLPNYNLSSTYASDLYGGFVLGTLGVGLILIGVNCAVRSDQND
ncbi:MAG: hypothetical protein A4E32_00296 [Methanomassiliicoccales archaeon PtaU1.Bin124]|nr:MAG: hypothetical protein A4E32_00296 [Methanomassiliicoccales archaeon PtaU1.Bin124]